MNDPSRWGEFVDRRAAIEDAKIRRCTCGALAWEREPCGACGSCSRVPRTYQSAISSPQVEWVSPGEKRRRRASTDHDIERRSA